MNTKNEFAIDVVPYNGSPQYQKMVGLLRFFQYNSWNIVDKEKSYS